MTEPRRPIGSVDLPPGTRVGHYSIIEILGHGGEAVVYRARDLTLDRDVALKSPLGDGTAARDYPHLLKEARAASRLSHPGIVSLHEIFEDGGRPWIAMDLVEGTSLRTVLAQRGALPVEDVVRYGEMLADALKAAHAKHVLHRDVTPGNVLVTADGRLLLADFGLAHWFAPPGETASAALTASMGQGHVVGTVGYMSPEQMLGREVGPQTDIFSAGTVLYQMTTGTRPFPGTAFGEVLDATLNHEPAPLSKYVDAPPELHRIIRKALAKRLDERYASAADLLVDLRSLRRKLESGARLAEPEAPRKPWAKRVAVGTLATAGLAVAAWAAWVALQPDRIPEATPRQVTSGSGWEAEARISPDGSDIVYTAEDAGGNVDIWLIDVSGGAPLRLTNDKGVDRSPAWYPDGSAIAFVSDRNGPADVWKVPRLGGSPTMEIRDGDSPAISSDGTQIAFTRRGAGGYRRVFVAPVAAPASARVLTTDKDGLWDHKSPAWSPDGQTICYASQRDLWTIGLHGSPAVRLTTDDETDVDPVYAPGSGYVYFTSYRRGTIALWRVSSRGGVPERVTLGAGPERHPSVSRDGTRLVYSTFLTDSDIVIRNQATGEGVEVGGALLEVSPALSRDASALAYSSNQINGRFDLWLQPLTREGRPSGASRRVTDHPGAVAHPTFSPDGRWVAYQRTLDRQRDIWIVPAAGGAPTPFTDDPAPDYLPEWSPDGRSIAFVSDRGGAPHVWVQPVAAGAPAGPARRLGEAADSQWAPAWAPDSLSIAYIADGPGGTSEIWVAAVRARAVPRRVTQGTGIIRLAWASPNRLLASGSWGSGQLLVRSIDIIDGATTDLRLPGLFGEHGRRGEFAVSGDGRLFAAVREVTRGDVWLLEAVRGKY